jgi:hypothetical protein
MKNRIHNCPQLRNPIEQKAKKQTANKENADRHAACRKKAHELTKKKQGRHERREIAYLSKASAGKAPRSLIFF